jgi:hypothetical protein
LGGAFMPARRAEVHEDSWAHGKRTGVIPYGRRHALLDAFLAVADCQVRN